jgi:hypothetical protein
MDDVPLLLGSNWQHHKGNSPESTRLRVKKGLLRCLQQATTVGPRRQVPARRLVRGPVATIDQALHTFCIFQVSNPNIPPVFHLFDHVSFPSLRFCIACSHPAPLLPVSRPLASSCSPFRALKSPSSPYRWIQNTRARNQYLFAPRFTPSSFAASSC